MTIIVWICLTMLSAAGVLCVLRLIQGESMADRILALDSLLIVVVIGIGVDAAATGSGAYLEAMLVVALIAFISTVSVARFIERRGAR